jgi:hypothetical protein
MVARLARSEFLGEYFTYAPGESVVAIAPNGGGKTHLLWQLAREALKQHPELSLSAAMPKPSDSTTERWAEELDLRITDAYPFRKGWFWQHEPRGYVYWPPHITTDAAANREHLSGAFKTMLNGEYWRGSNITLVDDSYLIACVYRAALECDQFLMAGRSNHSGLFGALQQPRGTVSGGSPSGFWYSQPAHLLLGRDGVAANRERFGEIACGLDPRLIDGIVANLRTYRINDSNVSEFLYINRAGPYAAIISPF